MDIAADIRASMGGDWLPDIYTQKVRSDRTRSLSIEIPERENTPVIEYTLLGIELKIGKRRFSCPDLATARYMRVFARVGCREFAVPYDISRISAVADTMELSWQRTVLLLEEGTRDKTAQGRTRARSSTVRAIRDELNAIGPGDVMPAFDRETRQRR